LVEKSEQFKIFFGNFSSGLRREKLALKNRKAKLEEGKKKNKTDYDF
jgi:hypothetical protein